ncbi:MAG: hypothetical protein EOM52_07665 [Clostridia bacterium]|nr:hypothetical protein [Clostridia bacterium]
MATKRPAGSRSEVVRCPNCGEDYSVTYKRCPFCDERNLPQDEYEYEDEYIEGEDDEDGTPVRKGGKRVVGSQRRGGGYGGGWSVLRIVMTVFSLALIVAAVWIVFNVISPMVGRSNIEPTPSVLPSTTPVATPTVTPTDELGANGGESTPPDVTGSPAVTTPAVTPPATSLAPSGNLKLSSGDFTMKAAGETYMFKVTGASGTVAYQSDKPGVAAVDQNGKVTAVSKGIANITVTDASGAVAKCIVRCNLPAGAAVSNPPTTPASGDIKLSREDFTLEKAGSKYQIKVTGASGTPVWSIGDTSVATISGDGTITAVARGTTTVTCTVGGQTLKCIVRCTW